MSHSRTHAYYNENDAFAAAWLRELIKASSLTLAVSSSCDPKGGDRLDKEPMFSLAIADLQMNGARQCVHVQACGRPPSLDFRRKIRNFAALPDSTYKSACSGYRLASWPSSVPYRWLPSRVAASETPERIEHFALAYTWQSKSICLPAQASNLCALRTRDNYGRQPTCQLDPSSCGGPCIFQNTIFGETGKRVAIQFRTQHSGARMYGITS